MSEPVRIVEESERDLSITWNDGIVTRHTASRLRRACPCASCVNEWTGEKMLLDESVPDDISIESTSVVGRYALNFHFSDGHETGIYSFKYLRGLS
ncbi:MAG TPA: DUF971 domain-containing protein [Pyrinomonadaceae bacterium]|nr:DUF971 domain-containing protein [Pyrinomonadaceae bacterium]